jgi:Protein of unknown function (DUF3014)
MFEDDPQELQRRRRAWLIGGGAAVIVLAAAAWYWYASHREAAPAEQAVHAAAPVPATSTAPLIQHPLPAEGSATALPALNDSDQVVMDSLIGVLGRDPVTAFLVPQDIVRHVVVTVDNLPRHKLAVDKRPVKPTAGQTVAAAQGDVTTLGEANFARYTPLARAVQGADVKSLAVVYERLYPLFQQAYEDQGYPGKYFNDRMVEVIDDLLQTPEVPAPIAVTQPKVFYEYADPNLENRSAGQKLLIRMGPANARIIKAKLREFRAEIVKNH